MQAGKRRSRARTMDEKPHFSQWQRRATSFAERTRLQRRMICNFLSRCVAGLERTHLRTGRSSDALRHPPGLPPAQIVLALSLSMVCVARFTHSCARAAHDAHRQTPYGCILWPSPHASSSSSPTELVSQTPARPNADEISSARSGSNRDMPPGTTTR